MKIDFRGFFPGLLHLVLNKDVKLNAIFIGGEDGLLRLKEKMGEITDLRRGWATFVII
jgi:hypothetical protein